MLAIVADSAAYLTEKEARSLGVRIAPFVYTVDETRFTETFADKNGEYEPMIRSGKAISTAPCSVAEYLSIFKELVNKGFDVLCINISSRLSGAHRNAKTAAEKLSTDKLLIFDSQTGAAPMEFIIRKARELADKGLSLREIGAELEEYRSRCGLCFSVDNIEALRRSGRLATLRKSVGTILNIKPILKLKNGAITFYSTAKGKSDQVKIMAGLIPEAAEEIILQHFGSAELAGYLISIIKENFPHEAIKIKSGGPVLGIHLGLSCIVAAWRE